MAKRVKEDIKRFFCDYYRFIFVGVLIGTLSYFLLMSGELVNNYDGIWHPSNFVAGDFEISLGRPFERYLDRARFGIVSSSLNSIMVFLLIGLGDALILKKFGNKSPVAAYLFLFLTIANPMVGELLSYYYLAVNYAFAWLFSILAFFVLPEKTENIRQFIGYSALGGLMLAFSMCFYQAYIGVACVLAVFCVMKQLKEQADRKRILGYAGSVLCSVAFGGVFYLIITKIMLSHAGVGLSSYKGADSVSLSGMILALPASVVSCYRQFVRFVFTDRFDTRLEFSGIMVILLMLGALAAIAFEAVCIFKKSRAGAVVYVLMLLIMPVAACAVVLIAVGNSVTGLMAMGILIGFLMIYIIAGPESAGRKIYFAGLCIAGWFMFHQVQNDQLALKEGMNATTVLAENMIDDIFDMGYPKTSDTVAFVGRAAENPRFSQSGAFGMANEYAQFGKWSTDPRNNRATWYGITTKLCGTNINLCPDDIYTGLIDTDTVENMPVYPEKGSIAVVDGIMVVKVSELYR